MSTCWVLYDFLYAAKKGERNISISEIRKSFKNFSKIFEKVLKIVTGWKTEIECFFSFILSRGLTQATLALLVKIFCLKLLFITTESGVLKGSAAILLKQEEFYHR